MTPSESPVGGLESAVTSNDLRTALVALRDRLARQIDGCDSARDVAALAARLADVLQQIAALPPERKGTALDELARRRAAGDGVAARQVRPGAAAK